MNSTIYAKFIRFLREELALSSESISTVERAVEQNPAPIPMILWQYGLVTLEELDRIYDWLHAKAKTDIG